jgi:hypothetical protein
MNFLRGATELLSGALKSGPAVCADIGKLQYDARAHADHPRVICAGDTQAQQVQVGQLRAALGPA